MAQRLGFRPELAAAEAEMGTQRCQFPVGG